MDILKNIVNFVFNREKFFCFSDNFINYKNKKVSGRFLNKKAFTFNHQDKDVAPNHSCTLSSWITHNMFYFSDENNSNII